MRGVHLAATSVSLLRNSTDGRFLNLRYVLHKKGRQYYIQHSYIYGTQRSRGHCASERGYGPNKSRMADVGDVNQSGKLVGREAVVNLVLPKGKVLCGGSDGSTHAIQGVIQRLQVEYYGRLAHLDTLHRSPRGAEGGSELSLDCWERHKTPTTASHSHDLPTRCVPMQLTVLPEGDDISTQSFDLLRSPAPHLSQCGEIRVRLLKG